jgi:hypothetical protein
VGRAGDLGERRRRVRFQDRIATQVDLGDDGGRIEGDGGCLERGQLLLRQQDHIVRRRGRL